MTVRPAPLQEAVEALRADETSASAYVEERLELLETVDPQVEAFVAEPDRRRRVAAAVEHVERRYADPADRPPLYGVPVGVKDTIHVDGLPTRAGSDVPPSVLAGPEAPVVADLRAAGAVVLGKTVTTQFASLEPGPTRNPHDLSHTPGGSSSGSAAAVAAGMVPLAVGTQTAGSVVRPAAYCGVVGFKPSYGRIPTAGGIPVSPSADHVGLFAQDVAGMGRAAAVVCDRWTPATGADEPPVLGVPTGAFVEQVDEAGRAGFEAALASLEAAGYELRRGEFVEDVAGVRERHERLLTAEFALTHQAWYDAFPDHYAEGVVELVEAGRETSVGDLGDARAGRRALRGALEAAMADRGVDLLVSPAATGPAPAGLDDTGDPAMNVPPTHAGLPSVTVPAGTDDEGLPLGLQIVAPFRDDERLLARTGPVAEAVAAAA